jgi:hypothetical protein
MVVVKLCTCDPNTWEAETGGLWVWGQGCIVRPYLKKKKSDWYKESSIRLSPDFSSENLKAKSQWVFKVLKGKKDNQESYVLQNWLSKVKEGGRDVAQWWSTYQVALGPIPEAGWEGGR